MKRRAAVRSVCVVCLLACGGEATEVTEIPVPEFTAPVTFVVTGIEPEIFRVDITVNGREMEPLLGSFWADSTDRIMMRVPPGDSINAFARAFESDTIISYIGEAYFGVATRDPQEVVVPLKYKGPHAPF